jgi:hypothetical protein
MFEIDTLDEIGKIGSEEFSIRNVNGHDLPDLFDPASISWIPMPCQSAYCDISARSGGDWLFVLRACGNCEDLFCLWGVTGDW